MKFITFTCTLPLPPSDNNLSRGSGAGHYPSAQYVAWLEYARPQFLAALPRSYKTDTTDWWVLNIYVHMPNRRGDGMNRRKAVEDLLQGTHVERGKIVRFGRGLFDDDKRIRCCTVTYVDYGSPDPHVDVCAVTCAPPSNAAPRKVRASRTRKDASNAVDEQVGRA